VSDQVASTAGTTITHGTPGRW